MSDSWNLVAAGPSMERLCQFHFIPDSPVVTVNRAMLIAQRGLQVDFAAFADGPAGAWELCGLEKAWKPEIVLWVSMRPVRTKGKLPGSDEEIDLPGPPLMRIWDRALPCSVGLRVLPYGDIEDEEHPGMLRAAFTTFCAFRRILEYKPKKIRVLCMDMDGSWIPGKTAEECHAHDMERNQLDRWKHERTAMEKIIAKARGEGIVVELVTP